MDVKLGEGDWEGRRFVGGKGNSSGKKNARLSCGGEGTWKNWGQNGVLKDWWLNLVSTIEVSSEASLSCCPCAISVALNTHVCYSSSSSLAYQVTVSVLIAPLLQLLRLQHVGPWDILPPLAHVHVEFATQSCWVFHSLLFLPSRSLGHNSHIMLDAIVPNNICTLYNKSWKVGASIVKYTTPLHYKGLSECQNYILTLNLWRKTL